MSRTPWLSLLAVLILITACTGSDGAEQAVPASGDAISAPEPAAVDPTAETQTAEPAAEPTSETLATPGVTLGLPDLEQAGSVDLAPLGTFVVARQNAGIRRTSADGQQSHLEIPVYETPFGPPRVPLYINEVDGGIALPLGLLNLPDTEGVLVMRVIAGDADDDWIMVQSPTRPHNSYVWVRRSDFDFGFTSMRIEIDLADAGGLTLYDGSREVLQTNIVHGRDSRPTPTHVTYIEKGIRGASVSPAYGTAILAMASYSDVLGTFGGGGLPSNFMHGTNEPGLMGQQVSSGEIRVPNEVLEQIIQTITPGTPVLIFNSDIQNSNKEAILERTWEPARTINFAESTSVTVDSTWATTPQLWRRCPAPTEEPLVCRMGIEAPAGSAAYPYLIAKPSAGEFNEEVGANVIPVFDLPGGEQRMLLYEPPNGEPLVRMPLGNPTRLGQALVLWPLEVSGDGDWIRVQAPVRPQRQSVWVRAADFSFSWTDVRIEIDIAGEGRLTLFDDTEELLSSGIVSGREHRPTTLGASYIDQVIPGPLLSPAYGSYVASFPIFSDVLSTFGGGGRPNQAIHGTNQPELLGQRVSSGNIRVPNEIISQMVEDVPSLLGARVLLYDSSDARMNRDVVLTQSLNTNRTRANTADPTDASYDIGEPLF